MSKIVIFGVSQLADLAHFYFEHDSDHEVVAFTVDRNYIISTEHRGLPVIAFEDVEEYYSPSENKMFLPISFKQMSYLRRNKYEAAKAKGYECVSYISSKATTWPDLNVGENCFIFEDNTIQPFVKIGNNVTLWSGNHIGHHATINDNCFISSHVVISGGVNIGKNCFIGVNATLRDHINIGDKCVIGAGTLLLADADAGGVYMGTATERSKVPSRRLKNI